MIVLIGVVFKWLFVDGDICRVLDRGRFCVMGGNGVRQKVTVPPLIIGKIVSYQKLIQRFIERG